MLDLVRFELKKLLARRTSQVVAVGVLALLCVIMALNVVQTKTRSDAGEIVGGTAAIAQQKARAEAHEGVLTVERVQEEVAAYKALAFSKVDPAQVEGLNAEAAYTLMNEAYSEDEFRAIYDTYFSYLLSPWITGGLEQYQVAAQLGDEDVAGFYGAVAAMLQRALDDGMGGTWTFSDAERAYWTDKQAGVGEPLAYGYAGGWADVMACIGFLAFAMVAVCVVLTPVFAGEYQDRTDAVLLAARYGRSKLVAAKIVASLLFATAYFALATAVIMGVALAFFGAEGGGPAGAGARARHPLQPHDGRGHVDGGWARLPHDARARRPHAAAFVEAALPAGHLRRVRRAHLPHRDDPLRRQRRAAARAVPVPHQRPERPGALQRARVVSRGAAGDRPGGTARGRLRACAGRLRAAGRPRLPPASGDVGVLPSV